MFDHFSSNLHRFFIAEADGTYPLTISSIRLQSTSRNLEALITPLTILDNILSDNVSMHDRIANNSKVVPVLRPLISSIISREEYLGNQYVWSTFNTFILNKREIEVDLMALNTFCQNEDLLRLIFFNLVQGRGELPKEENQNLLKPDILKLFKNVTYLEINCTDYPLSLRKLLDLIKGTQITKVQINGQYWLSAVQKSYFFEDIVNEYEKSNFKMEFRWVEEFQDERLIISSNSENNVV